MRSIVLSCILILFATILGSCEGEKERRKYNATNLEEAAARFWRIQATYEMAETGEQIDFDFVQSCYNRDVVGSFHPVIGPSLMFAPLSNGEAIVIAPPGHYCERGIQSEYQSDAVQPIPLMMWYPDVNNLTHGVIYVTSDAYHNANTKVRLISYAVEGSDREAHAASMTKLKEDYRQTGAIPGPWGCNGEGKQDVCNTLEAKARNNGQDIQVFQNMRFSLVDDIPQEVVSALQPFRDIDDRPYICDHINVEDPILAETFGIRDYDSSLKPERGSGAVSFMRDDRGRYRFGRLLVDITENAGVKTFYNMRPMRTGYRYADLPTAIDSSVLDIELVGFGPEERQYVKIPKVYPAFSNHGSLTKKRSDGTDFETTGFLHIQHNLVEGWRGMAVVKPKKFSKPPFPNLDNKQMGLYISDKFLCEINGSAVGEVFDFKQETFIRYMTRRQ